MKIGGIKSYKKQTTTRSWRWLYVFPVVFSAIGLALAVFHIYINPRSSTDNKSSTTVINRSLNYRVNYLDSSYFVNSRPPTGATAYVRELIDTISADFGYVYQNKSPADLKYSYSINSHLVASYVPRGAEKAEVVWEQKDLLAKAVSDTAQDKVKINTDVDIPFREYSQKIMSLNYGLALALDATVVVTLDIAIDGQSNNIPISQKDKMQLTIPLTQSIVAVSTKYDKFSEKTVHSNVLTTDTAGLKSHGWWIVGGLSLVLIGSVLMWSRPWRLWRRDMERNPYKREINRIYRYHDGVIIRTREPIKLKESEIIAVASFDDLLNLSEELRLPIIANQLGPGLTRFFVMHDATVYSYLVEDHRAKLKDRKKTIKA